MFFKNINFKKWLSETYSIVSCKDKNNPNFQIWGALSDLNCGRKYRKRKRRNKQ
jgi:hypothetical protein